MTLRIGPIRALRLSIDPAEAAFRRLWPEARTTRLLDDSLSRLAAAGAIAALDAGDGARHDAGSPRRRAICPGAMRSP